VGNTGWRPWSNSHLVGDGLIAIATAIPALNSDDLEVQGAKVQTQILPGIEVVLDGDGAADAAGIADWDILIESRGASDRRFVDALVLPDSVGGAITVNRALLSTGLGQVDDVIDDIILYQRIGRLAVHGQGSESGVDSQAASVGNGPGNARLVT
jgi:hypothetical protein